MNFDPVTLTYECDLDMVKMNHRAKYLRQTSFRSKGTRKRGKAQRVARPAWALCDCAFLTYQQTAEL